MIDSAASAWCRVPFNVALNAVALAAAGLPLAVIARAARDDRVGAPRDAAAGLPGLALCTAAGALAAARLRRASDRSAAPSGRALARFLEGPLAGTLAGGAVLQGALVQRGARSGEWAQALLASAPTLVGAAVAAGGLRRTGLLPALTPARSSGRARAGSNGINSCPASPTRHEPHRGSSRRSASPCGQLARG